MSETNNKYELLAEFVVSDDETDQRLDVCIANMTELSRSSAANYLKKNQVTVLRRGVKLDNDQNLEVKSGDEIKIYKSKKSRINVYVLYQDSNVVVFNKPAGILSHPKSESADDEWTVLDELREIAGENAELVHRLDRGTSGVLVGAVNEESKKEIQAQFSSRTTKKNYIAICRGIIADNSLVIEWPILRDPKRGQRFKVNPRGREAVTELVKRVSVKGYTAALLSPKTGRTHQIRVHMAHLGHPIYGDRLYGDDAEIGDARIMLHAYSLTVAIDKSTHTFVAPIALDMRDLSKDLGLDLEELF